jgi:hypothetical protein
MSPRLSIINSINNTRVECNRFIGRPHHFPTVAATGGRSSTLIEEHRIEGVFIRDDKLSDMGSYEKMTKLMNLGALQTMTAVRLIEGMELLWEQDLLELSFLTVVPFFQVKEKYKIGQMLPNQRRDLRPGVQLGQAVMDATLSSDGRTVLQLSSSWGEPYSGSIIETFDALDEKGILEVESMLCIRGKEERARLIYRKMEAAWEPKHKWNPFAMLNPHSFQI